MRSPVDYGKGCFDPLVQPLNLAFKVDPFAPHSLEPHHNPVTTSSFLKLFVMSSISLAPTGDESRPPPVVLC